MGLGEGNTCTYKKKPLSFPSNLLFHSVGWSIAPTALVPTGAMQENSAARGASLWVAEQYSLQIPPCNHQAETRRVISESCWSMKQLRVTQAWQHLCKSSGLLFVLVWCFWWFVVLRFFCPVFPREFSQWCVFQGQAGRHPLGALARPQIRAGHPISSPTASSSAVLVPSLPKHPPRFHPKSSSTGGLCPWKWCLLHQLQRF